MAVTEIKKIAVISGSTRKKRVGPGVTMFLISILEGQLSPLKEISFSIHHVDIAAFNLPVFNEEVMPAMVPAMQQFAHEHSKAWSAEIARYDAYILVTPCYNGGPPGGIKNAIDYLYNEWIGKPMMLISYGIKGGKTASDSLKTTLEVMKLNLVETRPMLTFPGPPVSPYGIASSVLSAFQGQFTEEMAEAWGKQKDDILKGFEELKEKLVADERA